MKARKIELKSVSLSDEDNKSVELLDYANVLRAICRTPTAQGGMDFAEMEHCLAIIRETKSANGVLTLQEIDWKFLCERVKNHRWGFAHAALIQFRDDVINALEVDVEEKK